MHPTSPKAGDAVHGASFGHFLSMAHGSLREVETQILIAVRPRFISEEACESILTLTSEVGRLITGLTRSIDRLP
jgi:four helix bundle protein